MKPKQGLGACPEDRDPARERLRRISQQGRVQPVDDFQEVDRYPPGIKPTFCLRRVQFLGAPVYPAGHFLERVFQFETATVQDGSGAGFQEVVSEPGGYVPQELQEEARPAPGP